MPRCVLQAAAKVCLLQGNFLRAFDLSLQVHRALPISLVVSLAVFLYFHVTIAADLSCFFENRNIGYEFSRLALILIEHRRDVKP